MCFGREGNETTGSSRKNKGQKREEPVERPQSVEGVLLEENGGEGKGLCICEAFIVNRRARTGKRKNSFSRRVK